MAKTEDFTPPNLGPDEITKPPLAGIEEEPPIPEQLGAIPGGQAGRPGWMPVMPVAVFPILRVKNEALAIITRSDIAFWEYGPKDEEDIGKLIESCGLTAPAWAQLFSALVARDAAKFVELRFLKRRGAGQGEAPGSIEPPEGR